MATFRNLLNKSIAEMASLFTRKVSTTDFTAIVEDDAGVKYAVLVHGGVMDFNLEGQKAATMLLVNGSIADKRTGNALSGTSNEDFYLVYKRLAEAYNYASSEQQQESVQSEEKASEQTVVEKGETEQQEDEEEKTTADDSVITVEELDRKLLRNEFSKNVNDILDDIYTGVGNKDKLILAFENSTDATYMFEIKSSTSAAGLTEVSVMSRNKSTVMFSAAFFGNGPVIVSSDIWDTAPECVGEVLQEVIINRR